MLTVLQDAADLSAQLFCFCSLQLAWHPKREGSLSFGTDDGKVGIYDVFSNKYVCFFGLCNLRGYNASGRWLLLSLKKSSLKILIGGTAVIADCFVSLCLV